MLPPYVTKEDERARKQKALSSSFLTIIELLESVIEMTYLVLAENAIITAEGYQLSFDEMVDKIDCKETILKFSHGNFACSQIQNVQPDLKCEEVSVTKIVLATGEEFLTLSNSKILTTDNDWMDAINVRSGDGVKALTYNPYVKHPQLTPKIIVSVETYVAPFVPAVSFETGSDNLLLNISNDKPVSTLIPLRPATEYAGVRC